jgi:hypothetical protein
MFSGEHSIQNTDETNSDDYLDSPEQQQYNDLLKTNLKAQSAPNLSNIINTKLTTHLILHDNQIKKPSKETQNNNNHKSNGKTQSDIAQSSPQKQQQQQPTFIKPNRKYYKSNNYKRIRIFNDENFLWKLLKNLVGCIINCLTFTIFILAMSILLPIKIFQVTIFKLLFYCKLININQEPIEQQQQQQTPQQQQQNIEFMDDTDYYPDFLSPMELFWLHDSKFNKSIGSCLLLLDGNVNKNVIKELIKNRVLLGSSRDGKRLFPRFTQILKYIWGFGYAWVYANQFCLDDHIQELSTNITTIQDLQIEIANLTNSNLNIEKPLWKVYYKHNFGAEKSTILLYIYHMCFTDGVSLIRIFFKTLVDNKLAIDIKPRFSYRNFSYNLLKQFLLGWQRVFYECIVKRKDCNPLCIPNLNGKKIVCWSEPFSFVNANRLKLVTRSSMNDLLFSVLSGILRTYLQTHCGVDNPGDMNFLMPIDLRSNKYPLKLGLDSALATIQAPTNVEGCIPRLWCMRERTKVLKKSSDFLSIYLLINIIFYTLPCSLATIMARNLYGLNTVLASSIAASNPSLATVSIGNRSVRNMFYFHPAVSDIALSCSIISYGDEVRLSLVADSGVVSNPEFITVEFVRQVMIDRMCFFF